MMNNKYEHTHTHTHTLTPTQMMEGILGKRYKQSERELIREI